MFNVFEGILEATGNQRRADVYRFLDVLAVRHTAPQPEWVYKGPTKHQSFVFN